MKNSIMLIIFLLTQSVYSQNMGSLCDSIYKTPIITCKYPKPGKQKNYSRLDTIDVYSKDYPTKLIEGSGFIINKNRKIGSIGYTIQITRDINNRLIRVLKSEVKHYKKYDYKSQKSVISEITIYFDEFQQPDLAKYTSKTYISDALVTNKTEFFNLKENNKDNFEFKNVKMLLEETGKHIK
ncbi:hypothetical protein [Chryseobacterium gregarium]|uniref:hypothetical protein n=1 Tax=Chryseobacterium gregarium TaxID=456299 RepID=UPI000486EEEA|nr:hypothetical protein [Chryseobacterium gregarium]